MVLFTFKRKRSAALAFGDLNHVNNNKAEDLKQGTTSRYQQFNDAQYAAKVITSRLDVSPHSPKDHIVKK